MDNTAAVVAGNTAAAVAVAGSRSMEEEVHFFGPSVEGRPAVEHILEVDKPIDKFNNNERPLHNYYLLLHCFWFLLVQERKRERRSLYFTKVRYAQLIKRIQAHEYQYSFGRWLGSKPNSCCH